MHVQAILCAHGAPCRRASRVSERHSADATCTTRMRRAIHGEHGRNRGQRESKTCRTGGGGPTSSEDEGPGYMCVKRGVGTPCDCVLRESWTGRVAVSGVSSAAAKGALPIALVRMSRGRGCRLASELVCWSAPHARMTCKRGLVGQAFISGAIPKSPRPSKAVINASRSFLFKQSGAPSAQDCWPCKFLLGNPPEPSGALRSPPLQQLCLGVFSLRIFYYGVSRAVCCRSLTGSICESVF